jgi:hypothetical protein
MLIESMRDVGYSLDTALADIIDNSITAGASSIRLFVDTDACRIGILDDGRGMTEGELIEAMRPGSRSPLDERPRSDLGRFGLGLKTASFSQCRTLTVVSRQDGTTSVAQWDLDHVVRTNCWLVRLPDDPESIPWATLLGEGGTLVVWDNMDRTSSQGPGKGVDFIRRVDEASKHLELVFHRYLAGEPGLKKITISINNRPLEPFDPFHSKHPATIRGPVETMSVNGHAIAVQSFTLPHHAKVTPAEWDHLGGPGGYLKNQGFYVYREKRLIIHGTWFGLARQTELTKLTRVRVDIPNGLDSEWKVDVKKASVQPPYQVRERLRLLIERMGGPSKRVFTSRGRKLVEESRLPVWSRVKVRDQIVYRINLEHPVISDLLAKIPSNLKADLIKTIELASASLPVDALFADWGENPDRVGGTRASDEVLRHAIITTFEQLTAANVSPEAVVTMMSVAEPFRSNWARTEPVLNHLLSSKGQDV